MPDRIHSYVHLHLVSDATGETLIAVARAAAAQYASVRAIEHVYPLVRSHKQLDRVIAEIEAAPGMVHYTLVDAEAANIAVAQRRLAGFGRPTIALELITDDLFAYCARVTSYKNWNLTSIIYLRNRHASHPSSSCP